MTANFLIGSKGKMAVGLIIKLVLLVVILVIVGGAIGWGFSQFTGVKKTYACALGLEGCEDLSEQQKASSGNLVSAIRCAYYRCAVGCYSPRIDGIIVANHQGIDLKCREDLCLPFKDKGNNKDNKVCDKNIGVFSVRFQSSVLDVNFFYDKEFDKIDREDECKATEKITLKKSDIVLDSEDKEKCRTDRHTFRLWIVDTKGCELKSGIYNILSDDEKTAACIGEPVKVITEFSLSIEPKEVPVGGEFDLIIGNHPSETRWVKIVFDDNVRDKKYERALFEATGRIKVKVGDKLDIPPRLGTRQIKLNAYGEFDNLLGVSNTDSITVKQS